MKNIWFSLHYFIDKHIYNLGWLGCSFGSCDHQLHHYNQHRNGNGNSFLSLFYLNRTFFPYSLLSSLFFNSFKLTLINWYWHSFLCMVQDGLSSAVLVVIIVIAVLVVVIIVIIVVWLFCRLKREREAAAIVVDESKTKERGRKEASAISWFSLPPC